MIDNVDVVKELAVKNREIYLNKLDMDIDSNFALLKLTTTNVINLSINEVISAILNIENSFLNKKRIEEVVSEFFKEYHDYILELYRKRFNLLRNKKDKEDYISYIDNRILDDCKSYYLDNYSKIINSISLRYSDFERERLNKYISDIFYNKFLNKMLDVINNANMVLINNYHESKKRYELINEKTLK